MNESIEQRLRSLEDHKEIVELKAKYCNCVDGGWAGRGTNDGAAAAELFVEDAIWDPGIHGTRAVGKAAIREMIDGFRGMPFIIHNVMNPIIRIDGDTAVGQWHAIFCANWPENPKAFSLSFAIYDERYVRTKEGWRFCELKITAAGSVPLTSGA